MSFTDAEISLQPGEELLSASASYSRWKPGRAGALGDSVACALGWTFGPGEDGHFVWVDLRGMHRTDSLDFGHSLDLVLVHVIPPDVPWQLPRARPENYRCSVGGWPASGRTPVLALLAAGLRWRARELQHLGGSS